MAKKRRCTPLAILSLLTLIQSPVPASAAPPLEDSLRIVTFNVGLAELLAVNLVPCVKARHRALVRELRSLLTEKPTVLALQEAWTEDFRKELAASVANTGYVVTQNDPRYNGLVIVAPGDSLRTSFTPFACDQWEQWGVRRGVLRARFVYRGVQVSIIDTHTAYSDQDEPGPCQLRNFTDIATAAMEAASLDCNSSPSLDVVAGDFNSGPDHSMSGQQYDPVAALWVPIETALEREGFEWASAGSGPTWDAEKNPLVHSAARIGPYRIVWEDRTSTFDHVWIRGHGPKFRIRWSGRLFDRPVSLAPYSCRGTGVGMLSDHYAAGVTVEWARHAAGEQLGAH